MHFFSIINFIIVIYEHFLEDYTNQETLLDTSDNNSNNFSNESNNTIFLTGATGFLGCFLLSDILKHTSFYVVCLVRCKNEQEGLEKIRKSLSHYGIYNEDTFFRVKVSHLAYFVDYLLPKFINSLLGNGRRSRGEQARFIRRRIHNT